MYQDYVVYWIHNESETDIETQGYVGVTKNLKRRTKEHGKKPNFLEGRHVDIFLCGEKSFCIEVETQLRPKRKIGLNIAEGGGMPPDATGLKRSEETKRKIKENMVGFRGRKHSEETKEKMRNAIRVPHAQSEETKVRLSQIARNRTYPNGMLGRKHSSESIEKIRLKAKMRHAKKSKT
jgi:predicted GIY-YIG superfamily endonuclease